MKDEGGSKHMSRIVGYSSRLRKSWFSWTGPESVFFFTFHKCASTLFSSYILRNIKGLERVDYASQIYDNRRSTDRELTFRKKGYVYGPIRLSANPEGPVHKLLVTPTTEPGFVRDKIAIFFIRDPRDILVSAYYSFGYTHGLSQVRDIQGQQQARRKSTQSISLDEYVLVNADSQVKNFEKMIELTRVCKRGVILKYEDMIDNFESFREKFCRDIVVDDDVMREIHKRSRPIEGENAESHRRSGKVGGFKEKLSEETLQALNGHLENILTKLDYPL